MWVPLYGIREQVGAGEWGVSLEDAVQEVKDRCPTALWLSILFVIIPSPRAS